MAKKLIHILFGLLFIGTLAAMLRLLWLEGNLEGAFLLLMNPALASLALVIISPLFLCEYFFWRSTSFLVSYSGDEPVALSASIITAITSATTLLYIVYCVVHIKHIDNSILWFSLGVQFVSRLVVRILMRDTVADNVQEVAEQ